jgi:hypothetical protein
MLMRSTTCSSRKLHQEILMMEKSLTLTTTTTTTAVTQTMKCLILSITLRATMEPVRFHVVGLSPGFVLCVSRHHFQARSLYANLPPKVLTSLRRFPGPSTLKFSHAVRQTVPPQCSNHNNSFSCSPKFATSTPLYSRFGTNLMTQNAVALILIVVLTDFKTKSTSTLQSHGLAYIVPPPTSPAIPPLFQSHPLLHLLPLITTGGGRPPSMAGGDVLGLGMVNGLMMTMMSLR